MKFNLKIDVVLLIVISEEETVKRLSTRRTCRKCGKVYNLVTNPPKIDGVCEICGGELYQREDDTPISIRKRLDVYKEQTTQVIEEAKKEGVLIEVNGERPIEIIHEEIVAKLAK